MNKKKVHFKDEAKGTPLATVFEVESYKRIYNPNATDPDINCACKCTVF